MFFTKKSIHNEQIEASSMETAATATEWKEERAEFMFCFLKYKK